MKPKFPILLTLATFLLQSVVTTTAYAEAPERLPEFTAESPELWINSAPLRVDNLRGKVVLLDIWTFACWNCYRSFPWLNSLQGSLPSEDFQIVGVHSPELDHEKDPAGVKQKVAEFELHHPVMIDNDFRYWRSLHNESWPTFYVVDRKGMIRGRFSGETHRGDPRAKEIEALIRALLDEGIAAE